LLVDTPAQVTVIWRNVIGTKNLNKMRYNLKGLGSNNILSYGCKNIQIKINKEKYDIEAHVIENAHKQYDGLTGYDFLLANGAKIDISARQVTLNGTVHSIITLAEESARSILACLGKDNTSSTRIDMQAILINPKPITMPKTTSKIVHIPLPRKLRYNSMYIINPISENDTR
jgi:hypothetical protein